MIVVEIVVISLKLGKILPRTRYSIDIVCSAKEWNWMIAFWWRMWHYCARCEDLRLRQVKSQSSNDVVLSRRIPCELHLGGSWVIASSLGLVFGYNNFFESEVKISRCLCCGREWLFFGLFFFLVKISFWMDFCASVLCQSFTICCFTIVM